MIFYSFVKPPDVKVSLARMISLLLLATSALGFSPLTPIAAVASPIDNNTATDMMVLVRLLHC
jgi:hypothetical protein